MTHRYCHAPARIAAGAARCGGDAGDLLVACNVEIGIVMVYESACRQTELYCRPRSGASWRAACDRECCELKTFAVPG